MKVLCISGKAQHGKDTTAGMLKDALEADGYKVLVTHYADLLKYICQTFFNWDGNKDEHGRYILQYVGTDVIRKKNPDQWVEFVANILTMFSDEWDYVLIPDCRFPNEIDYMKTQGFDVTHLRVVRPGFQSPLSKEQQKHLSEVALDDVTPDHIIENDAGLYELRMKIVDWLVEQNGLHQVTMAEVSE